MLERKKFINDPANLTKELLEGYVLAYPGKVKLGGENIVVRAEPKPEDKVAIVTLGGTGHEPALSGFVGYGLLDASVAGDIFDAPYAPRILEALRMMKRDAGIILVVLNHKGDVERATLAFEMAKSEGIKVKWLLTHDDISEGIDQPIEIRRGLSGCLPLYKIMGAAAEEGKSLEEVFEIGERFNKNVATLAVATRSATHPQTNDVFVDLPEGIMEIGMGQHGEGGVGHIPILSANETAEIMLNMLLKQLKPTAGANLLLFINGVGATTQMELNIVFRATYKLLEEKGFKVVASRIDEMLTVQEQAGFQMLIGIMDDDHIYYYNKTSNAPYWTNL